MPESLTTRGRSDICNSEPDHIDLRFANCVGTRIYCTFAAQWLAYALPYRRFASTLGLDFTKKVRRSMRERQMRSGRSTQHVGLDNQRPLAAQRDAKVGQLSQSHHCLAPKARRSCSTIVERAPAMQKLVWRVELMAWS